MFLSYQRMCHVASVVSTVAVVTSLHLFCCVLSDKVTVTAALSEVKRCGGKRGILLNRTSASQ